MAFYMEENILNFHTAGQVYILHDITFGEKLSSSYFFYNTPLTTSITNPRGNQTICSDSLKLENCSLVRPLTEFAGTLYFNLKRHQ